MNDFEEKSHQIRSLASLPPDQLADHLSEAHPNIGEVAPNVAPHVHSSAINAVTYLNSKLPGMGNELAQDTQAPVSAAQQNAWLKLHKTVSDPLSIFDHIERGTVTQHQIDAIKSVYPDLHQNMVEKMSEKLGELNIQGEKLPYAKRVAISKFIGQPLDSTMTPQVMQSIIASAGPNQGPQAQQGQGGQKKASGTALTQINKVNSLYQTLDQKRLSGK